MVPYRAFGCRVWGELESLGRELHIEGADREIKLGIGRTIPKMDSLQLVVDTMIHRIGAMLKSQRFVPFGYPRPRVVQVVPRVVLSDEDSHSAPPDIPPDMPRHPPPIPRLRSSRLFTIST